MKAHNGMRPQDIVILLKILTIKENWQYRDLSNSLSMSLSEVSSSLNRSFLGGLIDESKKQVFRQSLMEFIEHGIQYVFPQHPGTMVTGIPTAHSYGVFNDQFKSDEKYVWPDENGSMRGLSIAPLYKGVPISVKHDNKLYSLLAAIDIIRLGKTRELAVALEILKKDIL
jgi:hypothetical protein